MNVASVVTPIVTMEVLNMKDVPVDSFPKICAAKSFCIQESGPAFVLEKVAQLERTEDLKFSPNGQKLAVAGYAKQSIVIFDIEIDASGTMPKVIMHDYVELTSEVFNFPHGLDFVDDDTLAIANRKGVVTVFQVPPSGANNKRVLALPLATIKKADTWKKIHSPGSLAVSNITPDGYELLVCNNYRNQITRHEITGRKTHIVKSNKIVLERNLNVPDGVTMSADNQFFAVSNHFRHEVNIFRNDGKYHRRTLPLGTLKGLDFPHGLRFFGDDNYLMVADAGLPYLRLFHCPDGNWEGEFMPICSIRVMSEEVYLKGHYYHQEGGPKGLDLNPDGQILATTCEMQPLKFYHMQPLLAAATG